jgi:hypothetical protein
MNKKNFWLRGRNNQLRFNKIKMNIKTDILVTLYGLFSALIILLPLGLLIFQFLMVFGYSKPLFYFYLFVIWLAVLLFNGLLNYLIVFYSKLIDKENKDLQEIEVKYVFLYQCLNIGFAIISLIIIVVFGLTFFGG